MKIGIVSLLAVAALLSISEVRDIMVLCNLADPLTPAQSGAIMGFMAGVGLKGIVLITSIYLAIRLSMPKTENAQGQLERYYVRHRLFATERGGGENEYVSQPDSNLAEVYNSIDRDRYPEKFSMLLEAIKIRIEESPNQALNRNGAQ